MTKIPELKLPDESEKNPVYLTEEEIRAIIANELVFYREPTVLTGGSIESANYKGGSGGFKLDGTGATVVDLGQGSAPTIQGWGNTCTFSAVDADTVQWSSGAITLADGTIYNIIAGNTGNMSALTYIYFEASSPTILKTTTTQATAVGSNKILVAVAENNTDITSDATFQVFGGSGGVLLVADNIAANTLTANEIAANTITATEMNVSQLSAIAVDAGSLTAGTITGLTIQTATSGRRIQITTDQFIRWKDGTDTEAFIQTDSVGRATFDADDSITLVSDGSGDDIRLESDTKVTIETNGRIDSYYNHDGGSDDANWYSNSNLRMKCNQDGDLSIDGTYSDGGADFAEMFESFNGKEIQSGISVSLIGDKVKPAKDGDVPFGVVSANPTIIGNDPIVWNDKYLKDEFGAYIIEEAEFWVVYKQRKKEYENNKKKKKKKNKS